VAAQFWSKLSQNDIYIYLRLSLKDGAKLPSQKKVVRVQSRRDGNSAGTGKSGTCIVCTHKLTGRRWSYDPGRVAIEPQHDFG
jgi:hypothetical protein